MYNKDKSKNNIIKNFQNNHKHGSKKILMNQKNKLIFMEKTCKILVNAQKIENCYQRTVKLFQYARQHLNQIKKCIIIKLIKKNF